MELPNLLPWLPMAAPRKDGPPSSRIFRSGPRRQPGPLTPPEWNPVLSLSMCRNGNPAPAESSSGNPKTEEDLCGRLPNEFPPRLANLPGGPAEMKPRSRSRLASPWFGPLQEYGCAVTSSKARSVSWFARFEPTPQFMLLSGAPNPGPVGLRPTWFENGCSGPRPRPKMLRGGKETSSASILREVSPPMTGP